MGDVALAAVRPLRAQPTRRFLVLLVASAVGFWASELAHIAIDQDHAFSLGEFSDDTLELVGVALASVTFRPHDYDFGETPYDLHAHARRITNGGVAGFVVYEVCRLASLQNAVVEPFESAYELWGQGQGRPGGTGAHAAASRDIVVRRSFRMPAVSPNLSEAGHWCMQLIMALVACGRNYRQGEYAEAHRAVPIGVDLVSVSGGVGRAGAGNAACSSPRARTHWHQSIQ